MEDNPADADLCIRRLERSNIDVDLDVARSAQEFMQLAGSQVYDVILADYNLPDWSGLEALHWVRSLNRDTPMVLVTGTLGDELAIECMKAGVTDYVLKDNLERLPTAVRRALEEHKVNQTRNRAFMQLRAAEEQYRMLFYANSQPMWVFDRHTLRFLTVNDAAIRHYGYSLKEFLSMTVRDIRPQDEIQRYLAAVNPEPKRLSNRELCKHRKKDGTVIDVEVSSQTTTFRAVEAELVLAHDVTAQRRAESEVRAGKEQLQLLLNSTAEAIYAIDVEGTCTLCNAACLRLLGYDHESEMLGKPVHDLIHHTRTDGQPYPVEECMIHRQSVATHITDEVFWRADGTCFPAEYWSYPILQDGAVVGSVITFFDITERMKAEEQLKRSESRYRSIIESAPYGIYWVDQSGYIVLANAAFVNLLGFQSEQEVLGLDTRQIYLNPNDLEAATLAASRGDSSHRFETKWKRHDKKTITVRLVKRRLTGKDELVGGYEVFVEDITEQRSLQKQFEHAQRMEAVGRLAGGVAHDFNNLLMVVNGYAQLMEESTEDAMKVVSYAKRIQEASSKASTITRQLLAFSRKQVVDATVLDLNNILKELGTLLSRMVGDDVDITMALEPELGRVRADRGQIEQVIMNLAVNARDAMPDGGKLTIETSNVQFDAVYKRAEVRIPPGCYTMLTVRDTGIGMTLEVQRHIFEPFFTTKDAGKGTGLGLAMVYGIVKQGQGFIYACSEQGKGSIFTIYLPRVDGDLSVEMPLQSEGAPTGTETVLLVDDDSALRDVTSVYLTSKGYKVLEASNASEALALCESPDEPIHLLISDLVMPGLGGIDLARSVMSLRPKVRVVLMSGYTDRVLNVESIGIEAHFLQKPFSLDALARVARSLLDKKQVN